ncbi:MAG: putative DNA binding domain-containing protein [Candidatus Methanoplasma sp.]|jgi:ATP-dependent DNA helicase RecG|nr:putative DNA binding domain-containing protein [Candidatus Methanoplasma sp.]
MAGTDTEELTWILEVLISDPEEECVIFKEARTEGFDDLGRHFSAISNAARILSLGCGWLIFGVDGNQEPVGTNYRNNSQILDGLRREVRQGTSSRTTFVGIYELDYKGKRIIMFEIPAAGRSPVAWKGTSYIREGQSIAVFTGSFGKYNKRAEADPKPAAVPPKADTDQNKNAKDADVKPAPDPKKQYHNKPFAAKRDRASEQRVEVTFTPEKTPVAAEKSAETNENVTSKGPEKAKKKRSWFAFFGKKDRNAGKETEVADTPVKEADPVTEDTIIPKKEEEPIPVIEQDKVPEPEPEQKQPPVEQKSQEDTVKKTDDPAEPVNAADKQPQRFGLFGKKVHAAEPAEATGVGNSNDWSERICVGATIRDLDKSAVAGARKIYAEKNVGKEHYEDMVNSDAANFLRKLGLTVNGSVTNAAMVLFSSVESALKTSPTPEIAWMLKDRDGDVKEGEIFTGALVLNVDAAISRIQNPVSTYAVSRTSTEIIEIQKYNPWILRELIYNAIAHQDYELKGRINILECEDHLTIVNPGSFLPGTVENLLSGEYVQPYYRNHLLVTAMKKIGMIDTFSSGIVRSMKMHRDRYLPLPDYIISEKSVGVKLHGNEIDNNYASTLLQRPDLDIFTVYLLDRVQKNEPVTEEQASKLLKEGVAGGEWPQIHTVALAEKSYEGDAQFVLDSIGSGNSYEDYVLAYITKFKHASRAEVDDLIWNLLPSNMTEAEKSVRARNLLQKMSKLGDIENVGSRKYPKWVLTEDYKKSVGIL